MTGIKEENGGRPAAGHRAFSVLAAPINATVLLALEDGPRSQLELLRAAGNPSQATLRLRLRELIDLGVLTRSRRPGFPRAIEYELSCVGRDLLVIAEALRNWLERCPTQSVELGTHSAKAAIKAFTAGWSSRVIRALAAKPLSLTALNRLIPSLSYPTLERRLRTMRTAGLIEPVSNSGSGTPYVVTDWLRYGVAPLMLATRWDCANASERTRPIGRLDVEAAFLLTVPRICLGEKLSGRCRLMVDTAPPRAAGIEAELEAGQIVACTTRLEGEVDARASGSVAAWLNAVLECGHDRLELGGDCQLAAAVVDGLYGAFSRAGTPLNS